MTNQQTDGSRQRSSEIAQLNHELEMLRERYVTYQRSARMLRTAFWIWLPVALLLLVAVVTKVFLDDALMAIFFAGNVIVVFLLVWVLCTFDPRTIRWIDVASAQWSPLSLNSLVPFGYSRRQSGAQLVEEQIAERERRLTELTASQ